MAPENPSGNVGDQAAAHGWADSEAANLSLEVVQVAAVSAQCVVGVDIQGAKADCLSQATSLASELDLERRCRVHHEPAHRHLYQQLIDVDGQSIIQLREERRTHLDTLGRQNTELSSASEMVTALDHCLRLVEQDKKTLLEENEMLRSVRVEVEATGNGWFWGWQEESFKRRVEVVDRLRGELSVAMLARDTARSESETVQKELGDSRKKLVEIKRELIAVEQRALSMRMVEVRKASQARSEAEAYVQFAATTTELIVDSECRRAALNFEILALRKELADRLLETESLKATVAQLNAAFVLPLPSCRGSAEKFSTQFRIDRFGIQRVGQADRAASQGSRRRASGEDEVLGVRPPTTSPQRD